MNAQSSENSGINLPPPIAEQAPAHSPVPEAAPASFEQAPLSTQKDPTRVQPIASAVPLPLPPTPQAHTPPPNDPTVTTSSASIPSVADDSDLIEKEWVNKAKEIVERTRENPYEQSKELNLFKADYMKKRYNKTLKLSE